MSGIDQPRGNTNAGLRLDAKNPEPFLALPFAEMNPELLLAHFQNRRSVKYFTVSKGKAAHVQRADKTLENIFTFNNQCHALGEAFDWKNNPSPDIEWLILLHKFYYAKDLGAAYAFSGDEKYAKKWVDLIRSWIAVVPDGFINSQVTGRRLQQWLLSYRYFVPGIASPSITPDFLLYFLRSIHSQTRHLAEHLTPEGNHRTIELYAIFLVAVLFPELKDMAELLDFAKVEILKNMQADLLADGVQRELSPDYHHTVLKNYLKIQELAALNNIPLPQECDRLIQKALEFSIFVHKPDGFLPMISDGDANSYLSLLKKAYRDTPDDRLAFVFSQGAQGRAPSCRSRSFSESGYIILRSDWEARPYAEAFYLFFDCAPLGFGSHGHYDLLNFEMAAYGHTLVVDPGRYTYSEKSADGINWRKIFKGTAYHNTVTVDGKDQMPYKKGAPLVSNSGPSPVLKRFITAQGFDFLSGAAISHEYPVIHERSIFFLHAEYWIVLDRLKAEGSHDYDLHFHLHPRAEGETKIEEEGRMIRIISPNLILAQPQMEGIQARIESGFISPEYGLKEAAPIIRFSQTKSGPAHYVSLLYPYRTKAPKIRIECVPVYRHAVLCSEDEVIALKITFKQEENTYCDYLFLAYDGGEGQVQAAHCFEGIEVKGPLLMLRRDAKNHLSHLQADRIRALMVDGHSLLDFGSRSATLSYQDQVLHLDTDAPKCHIQLEGLQEIVRATA